MSGQKRPYTDDPSLVRSERSHDDSRREKPRDWRSAFLDDEEPGPSRHRGADQGRRGDRDGSADRYRERRRDDRGDRERERDGDRARGQRREVWGRRYDRGSRSRDRDGAREGHSRDRVLDRGTEGDGSGRRYSREGHGDRRRDSREREHTRAEFPHRTSNDTVLREPARASSRPDPSQAAGRGMAGGVSVREAADKEEGEWVLACALVAGTLMCVIQDRVSPQGKRRFAIAERSATGWSQENDNSDRAAERRLEHASPITAGGACLRARRRDGSRQALRRAQEEEGGDHGSFQGQGEPAASRRSAKSARPPGRGSAERHVWRR